MFSMPHMTQPMLKKSFLLYIISVYKVSANLQTAECFVYKETERREYSASSRVSSAGNCRGSSVSFSQNLRFVLNTSNRHFAIGAYVSLNEFMVSI
jgi:hypothetical protein